MSILGSDWSIVVVNSIFSCDCTVGQRISLGLWGTNAKGLYHNFAT